MSKILLDDGNDIVLSNEVSTYSKLKKGVYNLMVAEGKGFYLKKEPDFILPEKMYGDFSIINRWLRTYRERPRNLGVILSGVKGSGKTITAKKLCMDSGLPVIMIKAPYNPNAMASFLSDPAIGDCAIFMDEFEKMCDITGGDRSSFVNGMIDILDGTLSTHNLFVFTTNTMSISSMLTNRPSRIFYRKKYDGLPDTTVMEIAENLLNDKSQVDGLRIESAKIMDLSYDIVLSIIDDMNRYGESASEVISNMCLFSERTYYDVIQRLRYEGNIINIKTDNTNFNASDGMPCFSYYTGEVDRSGALGPRIAANKMDIKYMGVGFDGQERNAKININRFKPEYNGVLRYISEDIDIIMIPSRNSRISDGIPMNVIMSDEDIMSIYGYDPSAIGKTVDLVRKENTEAKDNSLGPFQGVEFCVPSSGTKIQL